jgi:cbb3-type cytochrome oxidase subunit 3
MTTDDFFLFLIFIFLIAITAWWIKKMDDYTQY